MSRGPLTVARPVHRGWWAALARRTVRRKDVDRHKRNSELEAPRANDAVRAAAGRTDLQSALLSQEPCELLVRLQGLLEFEGLLPDLDHVRELMPGLLALKIYELLLQACPRNVVLRSFQLACGGLVSFHEPGGTHPIHSLGCTQRLAARSRRRRRGTTPPFLVSRLIAFLHIWMFCLICSGGPLIGAHLRPPPLTPPPRGGAMRTAANGTQAHQNSESTEAQMRQVPTRVASFIVAEGFGARLQSSKKPKSTCRRFRHRFCSSRPNFPQTC